MITLYSTGCPKCKVIEAKLNKYNVKYNINSNQEELVEFGKRHKILSAPILEVNDTVMDFKAANDWIKETYQSKMEQS